MLDSMKNILGTMGDALALADAGEMLTEKQKENILSRHRGGWPLAPDNAPSRVVLAADRLFTTEAVSRAIGLCREKRAMLDLLCISQERGFEPASLEAVCSRLSGQTNLDFRVSRRCGDFLPTTEAYLRTRRDVLVLVIDVSDRLRTCAGHYQRMQSGSRSQVGPAIELVGHVLPA